MANAELKFKTQTKQVQKTIVDVREVKKVAGITLTLSRHEARALHTVLRLIGGDPETSLSRATDRIYDALKGAGVGFYVGDAGSSVELTAYGSPIIFKDGTDVPPVLVEDELPEPEEVLCVDTEAPVRTKHTRSGMPKGVAGKRVRAFLRGGEGHGWHGDTHPAEEWRWDIDGADYDIVEYGAMNEGSPAEKADLTLRVGARIRITATDCDSYVRQVGDTGTVVGNIGWAGPGYESCRVRIDRTGVEVAVGYTSKFEVIGWGEPSCGNTTSNFWTSSVA